jgi:hypothetical protein
MNKLNEFTYIKRSIKVDGIQKSFIYTHVDEDLINYNNPDISKDILRNAVGLKTLYHHMPIIEECVKFDNNFLYLKLLNVNLYDNLKYYKNAKQMLLDNERYYIDTYDLLNLEDDNQLYKLTDADVKPILNIISNP